MDEALLREHVDAVYGQPLEDFIDERDRHVKDLKSEGRREEAAALKGCRKPTVPAWAVDQLPRRDPTAVEALIDAATSLRDLQRRAASGGAASLRDASVAFRRHVRELRELAEEIIADSGAPVGSHLDDVERTLTAAAADPDQHDTLRRGVFQRPLAPIGFGAAEGLTLVPAVAPDGDDDGAAADRAERERRGQRERRERQERRRRLERQHRDLRRSRARQERRADRSAAEADELRERADQAAEQARDDAETLQRIEDELAQVGAELETVSDD